MEIAGQPRLGSSQAPQLFSQASCGEQGQARVQHLSAGFGKMKSNQQSWGKAIDTNFFYFYLSYAYKKNILCIDILSSWYSKECKS